MKKAQKELLKRIGFTDAQIATIEKDEDTFDGDGMFSEVDTAIRAALNNDATFTDPIRVAAQGEVLGSKERHLLKLAGGKVTQEQIDALPKKDRYNKLVELVVKAMTPEGGGDDKSDDDKTKEIARLNGEIQTLNVTLGKKDEEITKQKGLVVQVEDGFHLRGALTASMAAKGRKTVLASEKTAGLLLADITAEHDLKWDRKTGKPVLKQKGTDLDVFDPKDRSKALGLDDLVTRIGEANGYFAKNNGGERGGGDRQKDIIPPAKPGVIEPPGLAAARARQAAREGATAE